jgi:MoaA/NifB/PqqE/SkfB family radical SAM enzyme
MIKTRIEPQANYKSIFIDGKTIRMPIDPKKPITELHWPEFYDLSPGNKCSGGCTYCYAGALKNGVHYARLVEKINAFFGRMTANQRPFQVAIGGEQEPLENPEIWDMMHRLLELGIVPNYTTNGMFVNDKVIEKTLGLTNGVAVTLHMHLEKFWRRAIKRYAEAKIKLNVHVIISDAASIDYTEQLYKEYVDTGMVDYFVLLPYMNVGHAANDPRKIDYAHLERWVDKVFKDGRLAFGANFYSFIKKHRAKYDVSIYPPEIMSKYLILNDAMELCNNSFEKKHVNYSPETGCELGMARMKFMELEEVAA